MMTHPAPQARNLQQPPAALAAQLDRIEANQRAILRLLAEMVAYLADSPEVGYNEALQVNSRPGDAVNVPGPDTGKEASDADAV